VAFWNDAIAAARRAWIAAVATPADHDDFWYQPAGFGAPTGTGFRVDPLTALKSSAVFACVNKVSSILSTLPLRLYKLRADGGRELDTTHPLNPIISAAPNDIETAVDFWHRQIFDACLRGTGYAEIVTRGGRITGLLPLQAAFVRQERTDTGWRFVYADPELRRERRLLPDDVFRFPGLVPNGVRGLSICDTAEEAVAIGLAADQYAARVFANPNIGFVLKHPGKLGEQAKTNFLQALEARLSGWWKAHRPLLLQEGITVEKIGQTAEQAQLLDARKFQTLEVARAFGIPPSLIGASEAAQANAEVDTLIFVNHTLAPWARKIEAAIQRDLIGTRTHEAVFDFTGLLRGNSAARADYLQKLLGGTGGAPGVISVNEARKLEGLNPLAGEEYDKPSPGISPRSVR
jgi:HK97 family phage portal protein